MKRCMQIVAFQYLPPNSVVFASLGSRLANFACSTEMDIFALSFINCFVSVF